LLEIADIGPPDPGKSMDTVLIVVHLMVVIALVVVVLLQRSEGGALGIGGGGGFMTGRGQANALTKATGILGTMFFLTSLTLTVMANIHRAPRSVLDGATPASNSAPATPGTPGQAPAGGGSLFDQLQRQENAAATAAAAVRPGF
jgi:preprotein translocase subunit SecG